MREGFRARSVCSEFFRFQLGNVAVDIPYPGIDEEFVDRRTRQEFFESDLISFAFTLPLTRSINIT